MRLLALTRSLAIALALTALAFANAALGARTPAEPGVASSEPVAPQPNLAPELRQRLAEASCDSGLAPWQREFMMGMARDGHAGVAGGKQAEPRRAASPAHTTTTDGSWAEELSGTLPGARLYHTAIYDPVRVNRAGFSGELVT